MFKKSFAISFLFLACFLQLVHSLFPHEHNYEHQEHHHHNHNDSDKENGLWLFFSHFNHTSYNFTKVHNDGEVRFVDLASLQALPVVVERISSKTVFSSKALSKNGFRELIVFISPHLVSLQFRGPPSLLV